MMTLGDRSKYKEYPKFSKSIGEVVMKKYRQKPKIDWKVQLLKNALVFRSEQTDFDNDRDESEDGEHMQTEEDIHSPTEVNDSPVEDFTDSEDFSESDD